MAKTRIFQILLLLLVLISTSCQVTGFKKPVYPIPPKEFPKPLSLFKTFTNRRSENLTFAQKAVLELNGNSMPALGLCKYDQHNKFVALSLLTTTGIKILEVEEKNSSIIKSFIMPDLAKKIKSEKKAVMQIADDIKFIFFMPRKKPVDFLTTSSYMKLGWENGIRKTILKFGWDSEINKFVLKEKIYYIKQYPEMATFYYGHKIIDKKIVPMSIRYENYRFEYNLTITNTEILKNASK